MKKLGFICVVLLLAFSSKGQTLNCKLKPPQQTIHFGSGDPDGFDVSNYRRVDHFCPSDGYYSFASYTIACHNDDWHTLLEDHTPGDKDGNMLLVNAGRQGTAFLRTPIRGLKSNTTYQLGVWLMNLCKPTKKCPFPLLPNLSIRLETAEGDLIANIVTGELQRVPAPQWTHYISNFKTPASVSTFVLVMTDNMPSGCGNDFALDDITFRECVKETPPVTTSPKTQPATKQPTTKQSTTPKPVAKKIVPPPQKKAPTEQVTKQKPDTFSKTVPLVKQNRKIATSTPLVLKTRENALVRQIETEAGDIKIDIYDNGEIDGDTVSVYHNNALIRSHMRLSQKPISITLGLTPSESHHEIIMVAENLGSIPPNTSVMIITTGSNRYELKISSTEQKNAKVVFDLKK